MKIEDGGGSGRTAKISPDGELFTKSVAATPELVANNRGNAYNALFAVTPANAVDTCIFYMKNISASDLIIEGIWWQANGTEEVYYKLGDIGTPTLTEGADILPANLNAGSGHSATVTCHSNTADGDVNIEDLSGGTTIQKLWLNNTDVAFSRHFNEEQDIIVPKNQTFTIYVVSDAQVKLRGTVAFYLLPPSII